MIFLLMEWDFTNIYGIILIEQDDLRYTFLTTNIVYKGS